MTRDDQIYFDLCYRLGFVKSPFLEIGAAKVQSNLSNLCDLARNYGLAEILGTDLRMIEGVNFICDFSSEVSEFLDFWKWGRFSTIAIFNVLEHSFDPIRILSNALSITRPGGFIIISTPVIWPIHNFPGDYSRLLPDWYIEFAHRNQLILKPKSFCWLSQFGVIPIGEHLVEGQYQFPNFLSVGRHRSPLRYWFSRTLHKLFNTFGRSHVFTHVALGVVLEYPE